MLGQFCVLIAVVVNESMGAQMRHSTPTSYGRRNPWGKLGEEYAGPPSTVFATTMNS